MDIGEVDGLLLLQVLIIEKYLTDNVERKWLENRMVNGSLQSEYEKPYKFKSFTINE
jgi:hypothetical protein